VVPPSLHFVIAEPIFFRDGNSSFWLDTEPVVASGCPLADMKNEVIGRRPSWLSPGSHCYVLVTPGSPSLAVDLGQVFSHWGHLSRFPGSQGQWPTRALKVKLVIKRQGGISGGFRSLNLHWALNSITLLQTPQSQLQKVNSRHVRLVQDVIPIFFFCNTRV
jgi:hypothetical protein